MLPWNLLRYGIRWRKGGSQIEGFERYDLPLLASYSRSGTNWTRYTVEWISERPTPGNVRLYYDADYVLDRAHQAYPVMDRYRRVILVIRGYRECLLRHLPATWDDDPDVERFLESDAVFQRPSWYIDNIAAFDRFEGDKLLLYYEDLVGDPHRSIPQLADFLDLDPTRVQRFLDDLETHRSESVDAYRQGGHASETEGRDTSHHAKARLTDAQMREFDDYYRTRHPELFARYLARYALD